MHDIERLSNDSLDSGSDGPDHFKQAGVLTYWLRRFSPVYELTSLSDNQKLPSQQRKKLPEFFPNYYDVVLAFDLGFRLCNFVECNRKKNPIQKKILSSDGYIRQTCQFLKYKNVSPHALGLIYQSLFT